MNPDFWRQVFVCRLYSNSWFYFQVLTDKFWLGLVKWFNDNNFCKDQIGFSKIQMETDEERKHAKVEQPDQPSEHEQLQQEFETRKR